MHRAFACIECGTALFSTRLRIISNQNLRVDGANIDGVSDQQNSATFNSTVLHDLALELAGEWGLSENEMDMYFPPDQASTQPPMMIVAAANPVKEKVVGVCQPVEGNSAGETLIGFGTAAQQYLVKYEHKDPMDVAISRVQIKLLAVTQPPKHGRLTMIKNDPDLQASYLPDAGYYGKDRIEATVAVGKDIVRVVYNFVMQRKAVDNLQPAEERKLCPTGFEWKISRTSADGSRLASWDGAKTVFGKTTFTDLSGAALAQTTGQGKDATITLDTNAAGYGWFVEATPGDSSGA